MKQRYDKIEHQINRDFHKFQRGDTWDKREELALSMMDEDARLEANRQCALALFNVLKEKFWETCTMKAVKFWGFFKIHITKNDVEKKSTSQIEITITKNNRFNIHLNDYEHYSEFYYYGEKLTNKELINELENFNSFLEKKGLPVTSKLTKEEYGMPEGY